MTELFVKIQNLITAKKTDIDERGATAVEYALMVAAIAVAVAVAAKALGSSTSGKFSSATTALH